MIKETWTAKIKGIGRKIEELMTFDKMSSVLLFWSVSTWSKKVLNFAVMHVDLT